MPRLAVKIVRKIALLFAALLVVGLGYEVISVVAARRDTPKLFARYEADTENGTKPPSGLSTERIEWLIKVQDPNFRSH